MIFFHQFFFQRTAVYSYTNRNLSGFGYVHHSLDFLCSPDISRVNTDFIRAVFHGCNGHFIIKMNVRYQWNVYLFFNFPDSLCCLLSRYSTADNLTACCFQSQNLPDCCLYIFRSGVGHGLNQHRISAADFSVPNLYYFCMFPIHNKTSLVMNLQ